ncbi:hypothetical protein ACBE110449_21460 [Acinetobacter bereziniae]|uniref:Uncharacterized protein n=2 Tax=Acinetobacter bereziniae TaxID=106648 RepID=N8YI90_ACIBZ|nr:hypothetical protein F963_03130 [Acinetobacter bereziniae NIPH 3]
MSNNNERLGFEKLTEILTENEIDLLEDFREELSEPYRVCRRVNILRDYADEKTKLYPRN